MNFKTAIKLLPGICLGMLSSACSHQQLSMQSVYSSNDCAISEQTIKLIHNQQELTRLLKSPAQYLDLVGEATKIPVIDFDKQQLILVAMGQKPSSGYSILWQNKQATIKHNKLYLPVELLTPATNSLQAQVVTSPCQIFAIPKAEFDGIVLK